MHDTTETVANFQIRFRGKDIEILEWLRMQAKANRRDATAEAIAILVEAKAAKDKQKEPSNENNQG